MRGLTIQAYDSLASGGNYRDYLCEEIESYGHEIALWGGFTTAQFTVRGDELMVGDWLDQMGGRHVEVYSPGGSVVWEGFVDEPSGNAGPLAVSGGAVMNIGNRVAGTYVPMDTSWILPIYGITTPLDVVNDTDSQARYGVIYQIENFGNTTAANAADMQQKYLQDNAWPVISKDWSSDRAGESSVSVDLAGYFDYLDYPYEDLTTGTLAASTVVTNVLAATPNAWLDIDVAGVETNAVLLPRSESTLRSGKTVIQDATAVGGGTPDYLPWSFGIYEGLTAVYQQISVELEDLFYAQRITESSMNIETLWGATVDPWDVRPGRWLLFTDYQTGKSPVTDLRDDTRCMLIDKVSFRAPISLQLTGAVVTTVAQVMALAGLAGRA